MKTVKLEYPIEANGATLTEVEIKRWPVARDFVIAGTDLDDPEIHLGVAANVCEIAPRDFERLDFEDIEAISDAITEISNDNPSDISGIVMRRPQGRDVVRLKKDHSASGLVKVIAELASVDENTVLSLNTNQFMELVTKVMGFFGRRGKK